MSAQAIRRLSLRRACAAGLLLLSAAAWGQLNNGTPQVSFNGSLGAKAALLLIDGEPRTLAVGASVRGVRLLSLDGERAVIEVAGGRQTLLLGASPGRLSRSDEADAATQARRSITLSSGAGGHFTSSGSINGQATQFLIDTGASAISISQGEADRLGLNYRDGKRATTQTANGVVTAQWLQLDSVRIGEVEVRNVDAIVFPGQMSHVLLGNSFLSRFQMKRVNEVMTLQLRY